MNLGGTIKSIRKANKISQLTFAADCDISQTYASQIETNSKKPKLPVLERIAKALKMPLPILLFMSLEEKDIPKNKREAFKILSPAINGMIKELFKINN